MLGNVEIHPKNSDTGIDVESLSPGSNSLVWMRCLRCGAEFERAFKESPLGTRPRKHKCDSTTEINGTLCKWCIKCKKFVPKSEFGRNGKWYKSVCRQCDLRRYDDLNYWIRSIYHCKMRKSVDCDLTPEYLRKLWDLQHGRCAYTLVPMTWHKRKLSSACLERVDSNGGYTKNNVVWVSKGINWLKNNASLAEFKDYLSSISYNHLSPIVLEFKKLHQDGRIPYRKRETDAGYDLYSIEDVVIPAGGHGRVRTGVAISAPPGYFLTIEGRSSLGARGIVPFRGIIDSTYCGEMIVELTNISNIDHFVQKHDRIAQLIGHEQIHFSFKVVDNFSPLYNQRGLDGFGSSGA